jgi:PAP2 superfamily protein
MKRLAVILLLVSTSAYAGDLRNAARDVKSLATAPLHWKKAQWLRFGEGVGAVVLVGAFDKPIADAVQRNRGSFTNHVSKYVTPFGGGRELQLTALMYAAGALLHRSNLEGAGHDALESELWAAGVVTPLLKDAFGRARPSANDGTYNFGFARFDNPHNSFPSGHSTNVFAGATAIAEHYNGVVPWIAYTIAGAVAYSRVNDRAHWPSDVVAGALIGRAVAKGITYRHIHVRVAWIVETSNVKRQMPKTRF